MHACVCAYVCVCVVVYAHICVRGEGGGKKNLHKNSGVTEA